MVVFSHSKFYYFDDDGKAVTGVEGFCLSTDEKPTDVANGSTMTETDTGDVYMFDGTSWAKMYTIKTAQDAVE